MIEKQIVWSRATIRLISLSLLLLRVSTTAFSWGSTGHHLINLKAPMHLPASMASWRADSNYFATHASDADGKKDPSDTSFFAEAQRHYINIEQYPDFHHMPHSLDSVIALYGRSNVRTIGTQPWAEMMEMDSLTAQLARGDLVRAESTMADLGHYVGDAHQPLHCTQYFNVDGVHSRYESSMVNLYQAAITINPDSAHYITSPLDYIFDFIFHSNIFVDSINLANTYAKTVSGWNGSGTPPSSYYAALWSKCQVFTIDQFRRATVALASLWYTAWVNSQIPQPHAITTTVVGAGTIIPSGTVVVAGGSDTTFTFTPQANYHVDSVLVDGIRVDSLSSYTFTNVTTNHTISAHFSINTFSITSSPHGSGTVTPPGSVVVQYGQNQRFTFTPQAGHHVDSVSVDGAASDSLAAYTFYSVTATHSLNVWFGINKYTITSGAGLHGTVTPSGVTNLSYGDTQAFSMVADSGYDADTVLVDGIKVDSTASYTFSGVSANHTLYVTFKEHFDVIPCNVFAGWNLISVPLSVRDWRKSVLFPSSTSSSFVYDGGYFPADTLKPGLGCWLKFSANSVIQFSGSLTGTDTFDVQPGWNLVGSISAPIPVSSVTSIPGGMQTSRFFAYVKGYVTVDNITPGSGYWVKVDQAGQLVLSSSSGAASSNRVQVRDDGESPPSPPVPVTTSAGPQAPVRFDLSQSYPNPFNPTTKISFSLSHPEFVSLKIYDLLGREVSTLVNEWRDVGRYSVEWNAGNFQSGVYYYRIVAGDQSTGQGFIETKAMVLTK